MNLCWFLYTLGMLDKFSKFEPCTAVHTHNKMSCEVILVTRCKCSVPHTCMTSSFMVKWIHRSKKKSPLWGGTFILVSQYGLNVWQELVSYPKKSAMSEILKFFQGGPRGGQIYRYLQQIRGGALYFFYVLLYSFVLRGVHQLHQFSVITQVQCVTDHKFRGTMST